MSDYIIVLTILAAFSNVFTVFYFTNQLKKYDIKEDEDKKFMIMKSLFGILIFIVGICIYLYK